MSKEQHRIETAVSTETSRTKVARNTGMASSGRSARRWAKVLVYTTLTLAPAVSFLCWSQLPSTYGRTAAKDGGGEPTTVPARPAGRPVRVCVATRTANAQQSIWKALERFGSGKYRFVTSIDLGVRDSETKCDPAWPKACQLGGNSSAVRSGNCVLTFRRASERCEKRNQMWEDAHGIKPDFAYFWTNRSMSSWNVTSPTSMAYLPLGPQYTFRPVNTSEVVPLLERKYLFNFLGALTTSKSRMHLKASIEKASLPEVQEKLNASWILRKECRVVMTRKWVRSDRLDKVETDYLRNEDYRATLLQSIFTLCPAGHNPESYRLFEAAEAGSIPIVVMDKGYRDHKCEDSFFPLIESGAPFVVLSDWDELYDKLATLVESPHMLVERQTQVREWYLRFMTGVSSRVEALIDDRLKGGSIESWAKQNITLPVEPRDHGTSFKNITLPVIVVGMNKAGTSTIRDYFRCGGFETSHYFCGRNDGGPRCAKIIESNVQRGDPPLANMPGTDWEVYTEINDHHICYYPQMESLDALHEHYPNATFILNLRNVTQWAHSVKSWGSGVNALPKKLVECDLPGLPAGKGSSPTELISWFETHTERVRKFASQHPSHKLVEVNIDTEEAGRVMERNFGISAESCWGYSNRNRKGERVQKIDLLQSTVPFPPIPQIENRRRAVDWGQVHPPDVLTSKTTPAFLIIGAQKAGTTAFFHACTQHPNITRPSWKELHFFAGRNNLPLDSDAKSLKRHYRFLFGNVTLKCPNCITGEGTPQYVRFPNTAIPLIKKVCPWVKIVVLLRDPISRALSAFNMMKRFKKRQRSDALSKMSFEDIVNKDFNAMAKAGLLQNWTEDKGWVDFDSFAGSKEEERALLKYEEMELEIGFDDFPHVISSGVVFRGMYELQLRQWVQAFGPDNILVVDTEKDRVGPEVCTRFHNFMGLEEVTSSLGGHTNTEKVKSHNGSVELSTEMKSKLEKFFNPYNRRLEMLLGEDWAGDPWGY